MSRYQEITVPGISRPNLPNDDEALSRVTNTTIADVHVSQHGRNMASAAAVAWKLCFWHISDQ
ncbi:MAG TPA: hypothetical protein VIR45_07730 [Kiloniellaceae bacterium]